MAGRWRKAHHPSQNEGAVTASTASLGLRAFRRQKCVKATAKSVEMKNTAPIGPVEPRNADTAYSRTVTLVIMSLKSDGSAAQPGNMGLR